MNYKDTKIEIQKIPMRKTRTKHIIKGTTKAAFTSRAPGNVSISSIHPTLNAVKAGFILGL